MEQTRGTVEAVLECQNISKVFPDHNGKSVNRVLDNFSFEVHGNEFLVLFGPGQCGKSTLLNIMAGLEPPTSGKVMFNRKQVTGPDPKLGVVYQRIALFPWLTVMGNVAFGPKARGLKKKECKEMARHYIDLVGLSGFENHYPSQLSGGMRQRVGIARAYCNSPAVLLLDEPFGHLDAQTRYMMEEEIQRIWQKEKRSVVFVTNNIEEALFLADRIILMRSCPSTIKEAYAITMPHPRDYVAHEFLKLRQTITDHMDRTF